MTDQRKETLAQQDISEERTMTDVTEPFHEYPHDMRRAQEMIKRRQDEKESRATNGFSFYFFKNMLGFFVTIILFPLLLVGAFIHFFSSKLSFSQEEVVIIFILLFFGASVLVGYKIKNTGGRVFLFLFLGIMIFFLLHFFKK